MRWSWLGALPALLALGCSAPDTAQGSGRVVSERGLVDVAVSFDGPVVRGDNRLFVELEPRSGDTALELLSVDASMAAHAHEAHARSIHEAERGFEVDALDLFMTGRWQLELELAIGDERDTATLPVDVP
jgi:hypothetical protein